MNRDLLWKQKTTYEDRSYTDTVMKSFVCFAMATCLLLITSEGVNSDGQCGNVSEKGRFFTLSVNRKVDQDSGDWIRTYSVQNTDSEKPSDDVVLEATHSNVECNGKNVVRLEVVVTELKSSLYSSYKTKNYLSFNKRHGKNVLVVDNGRTAQKINEADPYNAVLFTNRPLRNNELFEIRLENKIKKWNYSLGIGVVSYSPDDVEILPENYKRNETWMMHHNNLYQSNKQIKANYGKNLNTLEANDRVGVMRRDNGELHFFMNGVDQGPALIVPEPVYGVLELWQDATRARIEY